MFLNRNIKLLSIILIILVILGGFIVYNHLFTYNTAKVGSTELTLPHGYYEDGLNKFGAVQATDGKNHIFLLEFNDADAKKHAKEYIKSQKGTNDTVTLSQFVIDGKTIYKSTSVKRPQTSHYWFEKDNKTYEVYKWDKNPKMDELVMFLSNS